MPRFVVASADEERDLKMAIIEADTSDDALLRFASVELGINDMEYDPEDDDINEVFLDNGYTIDYLVI